MAEADSSRTEDLLPQELAIEWNRLVNPRTRPAAADRRPAPVQSSVQLELLDPMSCDGEIRVNQAWDASHERKLAVYRLTPEASRSERASRDFWDRARYQSGLRHKNLVSILWIDKANGWVVAEFCPTTMADELRSGRVAPERVARVLDEALSALEYLHQSGYIHGEVSPGSMRVAPDLSIKLDRPVGRKKLVRN